MQLLQLGDSRDRRAVSLRVVLSGVALQWLLALFVLRSPVGQRVVRAAADPLFDPEAAGFAFFPSVRW